jgi:hypothetical protein
MTIPISQVKSLCTDSELALVQASRRPQLQTLDRAQLKRHSQRARKLFDKWQGLTRSQGRAQSRQVGFPDPDTASQQKVQIFQDALQNFDAQLAKLEAAGEKAAASKRSGTTPKSVRAAEHREGRGQVRKKLAEKQAALNEGATAPKKRRLKPAASVTAPAETPAPTSAAAAPKKKKKAPPRRTKPQTKVSPATAAKSQKKPPVPRSEKASTAAKQSRVEQSGLTSRVRGHVSARGKRSQGRRDSRS